jgi:hypothetical protein
MVIKTLLSYSAKDWFQTGKHDLGGAVGAVIGVTDMNQLLLSMF